MLHFHMDDGKSFHRYNSDFGVMRLSPPAPKTGNLGGYGWYLQETAVKNIVADSKLPIDRNILSYDDWTARNSLNTCQRRNQDLNLTATLSAW